MSAIQDIVCLSEQRWSFVCHRPQHLMSRAARDGRVFFVEQPVFDDGPPRVLVEEVEPCLFVCTPHLPPDARASDAIGDLLTERGVVRPVLWFYSPMALDVAAWIDASLVVYDCTSELASSPDASPALLARERALFALADLVFTSSESLGDRKRREHPRVYTFPSSVDADHFARARREIADPEDQRAIPRPRIGFAGAIDERVDLALLARLADARPDLQLVMLGPVVTIDPASLPRRPNLHWLGEERYADLPEYFGGWDAAMLPLKVDASTRFISPTKTLEYLAAGLPVVATPVHDVVVPYAEQGVVHVADALGFADAVAAALADDREIHSARSAAVVSSTSWDKTWSAMRRLVTRACGGPVSSVVRARHAQAASVLRGEGSVL